MFLQPWGLSFILTYFDSFGVKLGILLEGKDYFKMTGLMQACEKNVYIYTHFTCNKCLI